MEFAELSNGLKIPFVGLGTYPLKGVELLHNLEMAFSSGYRLIDTAGTYCNESDIGKFMKDNNINRKDLFLSSKVNGYQLRGSIRRLFLNRETVRTAYKHSCERLGVEKLDLFLLHQPFRGYEKAYKQLIQLYNEGLVEAIGVCNFDVDELIRLHDYCGVWPMVNQTEISPKNSFKDIIKFCQDHEIVVEAYSPFGRGHLVKELMSNPTLLQISKNHNCSVGQVVLRWIVQQNIVVIPRSTNEQRLKDNLNIFDFHLSEEEMGLIDKMNENRVYGINQVKKYK